MKTAAALLRGSTSALALAATTQIALAQRPPSGNQGPSQMSIEGAWNWLMARPSVIVAIIVILAAAVFMFVTRKKPRT
jgi:hypothetical protein